MISNAVDRQDLIDADFCRMQYRYVQFGISFGSP